MTCSFHYFPSVCLYLIASIPLVKGLLFCFFQIKTDLERVQNAIGSINDVVDAENPSGKGNEKQDTEDSEV